MTNNINRKARPVARRIERQPAPELPQITIKPPRNSVAACPVTSDLATGIFKATPRLRRPPRNDGYAHVSDLLGGNGKCIRRTALSAKFAVPVRPARLSVADRVTFAIGDAVHDTAKKIMTEGGPDRVWGKWKCQCGHLYHEEPCLQSEVDPDDVCPLCKHACVFYVEVSVFNEDYRIVGNPDLLFYLREIDAFHVNEIKSINKKAFDELSRPKPEHILQVVFYWWLMMMDGYRVTDRCSIFYINKDYQFREEPIREFMIDPTREVQRLIPYLDDARRAKLVATHNVFPIRKLCSSPDATMARRCELVNQCFASE